MRSRCIRVALHYRNGVEEGVAEDDAIMGLVSFASLLEIIVLSAPKFAVRRRAAEYLNVSTLWIHD